MEELELEQDKMFMDNSIAITFFKQMNLCYERVTNYFMIFLEYITSAKLLVIGMDIWVQMETFRILDCQDGCRKNLSRRLICLIKKN